LILVLPLTPAVEVVPVRLVVVGELRVEVQEVAGARVFEDRLFFLGKRFLLHEDWGRRSQSIRRRLDLRKERRLALVLVDIGDVAEC
jgi:hypothetical protein